MSASETTTAGAVLRRGVRSCLTSVASALLPLLVLTVLTLPGQRPATAQTDSVVVQAGVRYAAGRLQGTFLGDGYRDLWTAPIRVEVLDLARFAGGLEPLEPGGGKQTRTLHMEGADGRRYIFRSVDKVAGRVLPEDLRRTFVQDLFQDHISALHPSGALAVPALLDAVGILHVRPRLVVMPADQRLGEYQEEFAGMLGQIEERPNEGPDATPGFAGSSRVVGMPRLLERLGEDPLQVAEEREYLKARLLDFVIGDTDRGTDQWRWAGAERAEGGLLFRPIPRDRDWAFIRSEGPLSRVARVVFPKLVSYGPAFPSVTAMTYASVHRDRHLLTGLDRATWDSVSQATQELLTDRVIAAALSDMPVEHRAAEADRMKRSLTARRDRLQEIAGRFYERLAGEVDVRGTEAADLAVAETMPDGSLDVRLSSPEVSPDPYFHRRFQPDETREVRVYLQEGDDRAVVRGAAGSGIRVRLIGGPGDDVLADSTDAGAARVSIHDHAGTNAIVAGPDTRVDRSAFEPPDADEGWVTAVVRRERFRDWGSSRSITPALDYGEGAGVVLGARVTRTRYGFRRIPHAHRWWIVGSYALGSGGFGMQAGADRNRENSPWSASLVADGRQYDAIRFYGFGNDVPAPDREAQHEEALVMQDRIRLTGGLTVGPTPAARLSFGLRAQYVDPRPGAGSALAGSGAFGASAYETIGAWTDVELDRTRGEPGARKGYAIEAGATINPPVWRTAGWFGTARAEARTFIDFGPTLAFRGGWRAARGIFPVQEAAFIGGRNSLRGFRYQRFAGDDAVYGAAEVRAPLGRVLLLIRGDLEPFGFVDVGRVFVDGSSPGGWHRGYGGGLSFTSLDLTLSAAYARGEENRVYLDIGMPF